MNWRRYSQKIVRQQSSTLSRSSTSTVLEIGWRSSRILPRWRTLVAEHSLLELTITEHHRAPTSLARWRWTLPTSPIASTNIPARISTTSRLLNARRKGAKFVPLQLKSCRTPLVFTRVGTYEVAVGKQKTVFSVGTVYFRHGAKSEPGTSDDLRAFLERELELIKRS